MLCYRSLLQIALASLCLITNAVLAEEPASRPEASRSPVIPLCVPGGFKAQISDATARHATAAQDALQRARESGLPVEPPDLSDLTDELVRILGNWRDQKLVPLIEAAWADVRYVSCAEGEFGEWTNMVHYVEGLLPEGKHSEDLSFSEDRVRGRLMETQERAVYVAYLQCVCDRDPDAVSLMLAYVSRQQLLGAEDVLDGELVKDCLRFEVDMDSRIQRKETAPGEDPKTEFFQTVINRLQIELADDLLYFEGRGNLEYRAYRVDGESCEPGSKPITVYFKELLIGRPEYDWSSCPCDEDSGDSSEEDGYSFGAYVSTDETSGPSCDLVELPVWSWASNLIHGERNLDWGHKYDLEAKRCGGRAGDDCYLTVISQCGLGDGSEASAPCPVTRVDEWEISFTERTEFTLWHKPAGNSLGAETMKKFELQACK